MLSFRHQDAHSPFWFAFSPALIQSTGAMKCLLDAMLVLTKQDRLCHVIHATSEPFYQTWLRKANVMQHCKVRTPQKRSPASPCTNSVRFSRFSPSATVLSLRCGRSSGSESSLTYLRNFEWASRLSTFGTRLVGSSPTGKTTSPTTVRFPAQLRLMTPRTHDIRVVQ